MLGNQQVIGSCKATPPSPPVSQLRKERPKAEDLARVTQEGQQSRMKLGLLSPVAVLLITGPCSPFTKSVTAPLQMERMTLEGCRGYKTGEDWSRGPMAEAG